MSFETGSEAPISPQAQLEDVQQELGDTVEHLELMGLAELQQEAEARAGITAAEIDQFLYSALDDINAIPFENPAQKEALLQQIGDHLAGLNLTEVNALDTQTNAEILARLTELLEGLKTITDLVPDLFAASEGPQMDGPIEETTFTLARLDRHNTPEDYLRGLDKAEITIPNPTVLARFAEALGPRKAAFGDVLALTPPITLPLKRGPDNHFYLTDGNELKQGYGTMPLVEGIQIKAEKPIYASESTDLTAHFEDSREASSTRVDHLIDDPFVKKASITYTESAIAAYAKKYPGFPFKAGEKIPLDRSPKDGLFYFAGHPELPRAFVFEGDTLTFDKTVDLINQNEGTEILGRLGERLHELYNIREIAESIRQEFGIDVRFTPTDLQAFGESFKARFHSANVHLEPQDPAELARNLSTLKKTLQDYGKSFVSNSNVKTIYLIGNFQELTRNATYERAEGMVLRDGVMFLTTPEVFDHELVHAKEKALEGEGEIKNEGWFDASDAAVQQLAEQVKGVAQDGPDGQVAAMEASGILNFDIELNELPKKTREAILRSGTTSVYAFNNGVRGEADEVQAEMIDFLKHNPEAFALLAVRNEKGEYQYPQLRINAQRMLQYYRDQSNGEINQAWWEKQTGQHNLDSTLWNAS